VAKASTAIIGACGEHYVAGYLSGFHLIVAMPRAGIPGSDMFVSEVKGGRAIRLQVKTGTQATKRDKSAGPIYLWSTNYSAIERTDRDLWYAYVWLKGWPEADSLPEVFFVPSKAVVEWLKECQEQGGSRVVHPGLAEIGGPAMTRPRLQAEPAYDRPRSAGPDRGTADRHARTGRRPELD
jgi:hypothetical protein